MSKASIHGIELAYDDVGSGQAVVLLHGYPFNRSMWREQAEALSAGHRVITPDLRGFGESTVLEEPATMGEMAEDVARLLDELQIERATLGGLSMGGYVAFAFYRQFQSRVRALILADTRPQSDTEEVRANRLSQAQKILKEGMQSIADDFMKKVLTPATISQKPLITERVREMIVTTKAQGAASALRGMAERRDHTNFLPEIIAPTLIIVGSEDKLTPPVDAKLMHREIRGSRLEIIEGASHLSNLEEPEQFNRAIKDFLDALQP
ncbi:MAG: alpha/beta hydrolase [Acidobacteria bacterium]|nr:MAG: alpha/beta hydrolase [Acidobacteriota bacterium]